MDPAPIAHRADDRPEHSLGDAIAYADHDPARIPRIVSLLSALHPTRVLDPADHHQPARLRVLGLRDVSDAPLAPAPTSRLQPDQPAPPTIAFAEGLMLWPLAQRARLLLAGCSRLVDTARNETEDILAAVRAALADAASLDLRRPGSGHVGWDEREQLTGVSRTFRVECARSVPVAHVLDALRQLDRVESASAYYYCSVPMCSCAGCAPRAARFAAPVGALGRAGADPRHIVRAAEALALEPGDPAVIVAVVDTGIRPDHPAYAPRVRAGWDTVQLSQSDLSGVTILGDSAQADPDPRDEVGHGTACAGILSASGPMLPPGIAGRCSLLPVRVLGSARAAGGEESVGIGAIADIDAGVKIAADMFARVINMSFGTPASAIAPGDPLPHADVVRYALERGCTLVAASGNTGLEEQYTPACLPGVLAVGACDDHLEVAAFSTTGPHVALCAPGQAVETAGLRENRRVTGTSFAAPFVAGAAALLISRGLRCSYALGADEVASLLRRSVHAWPRGPDGCGAGVLDARAALDLLDESIDSERTAHAGPDPAALQNPNYQSPIRA